MAPPAWDDAAWAEMVVESHESGRAFLNLHKGGCDGALKAAAQQGVPNATSAIELQRSCGRQPRPPWPAEAFRLSKLLSAGATVVSECSAVDDEMAYAGLVTFVRVVDAAATPLPTLLEWTAASRDAKAIVAAFADRFEPERLVRRAGIAFMLEHRAQVREAARRRGRVGA